jgi:hypothetical protein
VEVAAPYTGAWSFFGSHAPDDTLDAVFDTAAAVAWQQFNRLWIPATGLAKATPDYDKLTSWDIASVLAALFAGRELGLLPAEEYLAQASLTLRTLETMPLFEGVAFNRMYEARTGRMVGRNGAPSTRGYGWSATDLGRLLLWLRAIADRDSSLSASASRVAGRITTDRVVRDGYMHGEDISANGRRRKFQEGRIGYEQYAARGFAAWGHDVSRALDIRLNAASVVVMGEELLRDRRGLDRLSSEPFVLIGLETGWSDAEAALAQSVLTVMENRYRQTRIVTIASEDAVGIPPHYFYYYCVYCTGRAFVIETTDPGRHLDSPRWVSTKATFAWHALLPSDYTATAVARISRARTSSGWSSGVFEQSGRPTNTYDLNTVAIILEAAAFRRLGRPIMTAAPAALTAPAR